MSSMKGPENLIVHEGFERATMNSRLAAWLQTPVRRRFCAVAFVAAFLGIFGFFAAVDWQGFYGSDAGLISLPNGAIVAAFLVIAAIGIVVDQLLFMAIRPVLSFDDEAFDERQSALVKDANGKARYSGMLFIAVLTAASFAQIHPIAVVYLGCMLMLLTFVTPHLVLAWTLPDLHEEGALEHE